MAKHKIVTPIPVGTKVIGRKRKPKISGYKTILGSKIVEKPKEKIIKRKGVYYTKQVTKGRRKEVYEKTGLIKFKKGKVVSERKPKRKVVRTRIKRKVTRTAIPVFPRF